MNETRPIPVTVIIPVRNEESSLAACLAPLGRLSRVVVVDSGSIDGTEAIAREFGAEWLTFEWNGRFPKKRNWVLETLDFDTEWVLFLDADEVVDEVFLDELADAVASGAFDGFWLTYSCSFMGARLRFGLPQRKLALFRVNAGRYERIDEERWSELDMEIHEHPIVDGHVGRISAPIRHDDYRGLEHYISKHNSYSSWEAARFIALQRAPGSWAQLTGRQRVKYRLMATPLLAPIYFFFTYVVRLGFLDGRAGLAFAALKYVYFLQIQLKIREARA